MPAMVVNDDTGLSDTQWCLGHHRRNAARSKLTPTGRSAHGVAFVHHPVLAIHASGAVAQLEQDDIGHGPRFQEFATQQALVDLGGDVGQVLVSQAQC